jgi:hypothetical protein
MPLLQHIYTRMYAQNGDCPAIWASVAQRFGSSCDQQRFAHVPWLRISELLITKQTMFTLTTLYYLPFARILLRLVTLYLSKSPISKFVSRSTRTFLRTVYTHLLSGRSVAWLWLDSLYLYPFALQCFYAADEVRLMRELERGWQLIPDEYREIFYRLFFWKDPWQDSLYVM